MRFLLPLNKGSGITCIVKFGTAEYLHMPGRVRRLTVYETPSRFYIVGNNVSGDKYNVLKIERTDSSCNQVLITGEPENDYSHAEIIELLSTVDDGSSISCRTQTSGTSKKGRPDGGLVERVYNAYGILGVVRFLEGYYMIIVTKATIVATFGYHSVYKVAEVAMISLAQEEHVASPDEQRYVKLFQSVDLSTDFYFSYTYDLSRSLQENALSMERNGGRTMNADRKFVWNKFLLDPLRSNIVSERWYVEVVHGFMRQQMIELPCCKLAVLLIGRRSSDYAGTRFLKRGANLKGDVANDVETEQIVWDTNSSPAIHHGRFSSFVQRRGSVPLRWAQDPTGVVGKPPIVISIHEPHAQTAGAHFRDLRKKYGNPIVVMNLVKRREKRGGESLLHHIFQKAIRYLNQFLPRNEHLAYLSFDVARCDKKEANVLNRVDELGHKVVVKHGWFQSFPLPHSLSITSRPQMSSLSLVESESGDFLLQKGVTRTNCVDCLDRTNVVQFGIGKVALAYQLCAMGVLNEPHIELSSDVCRVIEELFDEHGDTLAWQYAGSDLVHSVKFYKKTAAFQERSRDIIQTVSRYYNNTFGDYDKQMAIDLFLGVFRPMISSVHHLWHLPSDHYLHFRPGEKVKTDYCAWMVDVDDDEGVTRVERSPSRQSFGCLRFDSNSDYDEFYRTFEMTNLDIRSKLFASIEAKTISVGGVNALPPSSFRLWKTDPKSEKKEKKKTEKEKDSDDEDDDEITRDGEIVDADDAFIQLTRSEATPPRPAPSSNVGLSLGLQSPRQCYGVDTLIPSPATVSFYESYVSMGGLSLSPQDWLENKPTLLTDLRLDPPVLPSKLFIADDSRHCEMPEVGAKSVEFYASTCAPSLVPSRNDISIFSQYPILL